MPWIYAGLKNEQISAPSRIVNTDHFIDVYLDIVKIEQELYDHIVCAEMLNGQVVELYRAESEPNNLKSNTVAKGKAKDFFLEISKLLNAELI